MSAKLEYHLILKNLINRQVSMKIFEYLKDPMRFQILNKRFYNGIIPNWFARVRIARVIIRYTEVTPSSRNYPLMINLEFPSEDLF